MSAQHALYIGSFVHQTSEELSVDSLQFAPGHSAVVQEIRIISRNSRLPTSLGFDSLGGSYPSTFQLEVFAKNNNHPNSSSYQKIGALDYAESDTTVVQCDLLFPTNFIVFRGNYQTLTIALIGDAIIPIDLAPNVNIRKHRQLSPPFHSQSGSQNRGLKSGPIQLGAVGVPVTPGGMGPTAPVPFNPFYPPPQIQTSFTSPPGTATTSGHSLPFPFDPSRPPPLMAIPRHSPAAVHVPSSSSHVPTATSLAESISSHAIDTNMLKCEPLSPVSPKAKFSSRESRRSKKKYRHMKSKSRSKSKSKSPSPIKDKARPVADESTDIENVKTEPTPCSVSGTDEMSNEENMSVDRGATMFDLENVSDDDWEGLADIQERSVVSVTEDDRNLFSWPIFNPAQLELSSQLEYFYPPYFTRCEMQKLKNVGQSDEIVEEFQSVLQKYSSDFMNRPTEWLLAVEAIITKIAICLPNNAEKLDKIVPIFLKWTDFGLSERSSATHAQPVFFVRHLKVGIRFTEELFRSNEDIALRLVANGVYRKLLELFAKPHMALPMKLRILKAFDASMYFQSVAAKFTEKKVDAADSVYNCLMKLLSEGHSTRLKEAARVLFKKVAFWTTLNELREKINSLINDPVVSVSADEMCSALEDMLTIYCSAERCLVIQLKYLPVSVVYDIKSAEEDAFAFIYRCFTSGRLISLLCVLCSNKITSDNGKVLEVVSKLLFELRSSNRGLAYLLSQPVSTSHLVKVLLRSVNDASSDYEEQTSAIFQCGSELATDLRAFQLIDKLLKLSQTEIVDVDNPVSLKELQELHRLTFKPNGRRAVVKILSFDKNLEAVLQFLSLHGEAEQKAARRKSAGAGYAIELLLQVLRFCQDGRVVNDFVERFVAIGSQDAYPRSTAVKQWVEPFRKLSAPISLQFLSERLKTYFEDEAIADRIAEGLLAVLRLLVYKTVPDSEAEIATRENPREVKYLDFALKLFSDGTYHVLIDLIAKLNESNMINWQQGLSFLNREGALYYGCVICSLKIVRSVLQELTAARGSQFKDMTFVRPLLHTFAICCTLSPAAAAQTPEADAVRKEVVSALLCLTIRIDPSSQSPNETSFDESTWTRMVAEIITVGLESPCFFVASVNLLSELLPLPLPVTTRHSFNAQQTDHLLRERLRWSAHLAPLDSELGSLLELCSSTAPSLQNVCRRLCFQLADLGHHVATILVNRLLSMTLKKIENTNGTEVVSVIDLQTATLLNLLAFLTSHGSFKAAMLAVVRTGDLDNFLTRLFEIFGQVSSEAAHTAGQEKIISLLLSLCDSSIGLERQSASEGEQRMMICVPTRAQFVAICSALFSHIGDHNQGYATIIPSLRALLVLAQSEHGINALKQTCLQDERNLKSLLDRIVDEFNGHSSDCLSTLSTVMEVIEMVLEAGGNHELASALCWRHKLRDLHPLSKLVQLINDGLEKDPTLFASLNSINRLLAVIADPLPLKELEPTNRDWPTFIPLGDQFQLRKVWTLQVEDDQLNQLTVNYWLPNGGLEDHVNDRDGDRVACDLEAIRSEFLPKLDPKEELLKRISLKHVDRPKPKRALRPGIINTAKGDKGKEPLRGRGFQVSRQSQMQRFGNDPFRLRPQNTSRAPSMHVDDFLLAQVQHKTATDKVHLQKRGGLSGGSDLAAEGGRRAASKRGSSRRSSSPTADRSPRSPSDSVRTGRPAVSPLMRRDIRRPVAGSDLNGHPADLRRAKIQAALAAKRRSSYPHRASSHFVQSQQGFSGSGRGRGGRSMYQHGHKDGRQSVGFDSSGSRPNMRRPYDRNRRWKPYAKK